MRILTRANDANLVIFSIDDFSFAVWKEDPEDLTHLAPTAGDVCVPLDETPVTCVPDDMFDDIMLPGCDDLLAAGEVVPTMRDDTTHSASPSPHSAAQSMSSFFTCKDELEPSSRPHSPILSQVSNEIRSR